MTNYANSFVVFLYLLGNGLRFEFFCIKCVQQHLLCLLDVKFGDKNDVLLEIVRIACLFVPQVEF